MAFFLKQTKLKGRTYLAIYESFYNPKKKETSHRSFKSLGSVETHKENGIKDPVALFQKEVDELNNQRANEGVQKITSKSRSYYLGYFPLVGLIDKLSVKKYVDFFQQTTDFRFELFDLLSSLIYARAVRPCSKSKTFHDVLPSLFTPSDFSYDQLLAGLSYLGSTYEKFIDIFNEHLSRIYKRDTATTYFDSTNFYFEIDREDDLRRKGPSKENSRNPILGLGLLLDSNQIPLSMSLFPGNQSEKPVLREILYNMKKRNKIKGKTIIVADKGLNCSQNIVFARKNGDGYLFSKSVKTLPEIEKTWALLNQDFVDVKGENGRVIYRYKSCIDKYPYKFMWEGKQHTVELTEKRLLTFNPTLAEKQRFEINKMIDKAVNLNMSSAKRMDYGDAGKYVVFTDTDGNKAQVTINHKAIENDLKFAGYNLLVTSEINMPDQDIYSTYHNLWKIEEAFKIMKSDLDARPVFLQKENTIKGHFLICYLTVFLQRILQYQILNNKFSASEIFEFMRNFKVTESEHNYINTATNSKIISYLEEYYSLPLTNCFLSDTNIKSILKCKV